MSEEKCTIDVADVLMLVGMQERTGELVLESGNNIGSVLLHQGGILHAYSPYSRAIGDLMVEEGIITETELLEALDLQKKKMSIPLGTLLLQTGKVTFDMIERMVHDQIRAAVRDFHAWDGIHFSFVPKEIIPFDRIRLGVREFIAPESVRKALAFLGERKADAAAPAHSIRIPFQKP